MIIHAQIALGISRVYLCVWRNKATLIIATPTSSCCSICGNTEVMDISTFPDVLEYQFLNKNGYIYLANMFLQQIG